MAKRESILIFGGTFDPPHRAHVELPPKVARQAGCARIIYVPARSNPLKHEKPTPGEHRVAMLHAALAQQADAEISTVELEREGPSYFITTLESLRAQHPHAANWRFLIGCDQAVEFQRWREWERILELAEPIVLLRPPWTRATLHASIAEKQGASWADWWLDHLASESLPQIDVSATQIRERLAHDEPIDDLVTPAVASYIRQHKLYL